LPGTRQSQCRVHHRGVAGCWRVVAGFHIGKAVIDLGQFQLNGDIVLIVHRAPAEQVEAATVIMRRYSGADVFASPSA
jgi:hypothetical protein